MLQSYTWLPRAQMLSARVYNAQCRVYNARCPRLLSIKCYRVSGVIRNTKAL